MTRPVRIGLIGGGFIGSCHAYAFRTMPTVFPESDLKPELALFCDATDDLARAGAARFGAPRWTARWPELAQDPEIDVVDICVPSQLHRPIALAAIAAGKHVYCEKPVGLSAVEAAEIAAAAEKARVKHIVGYTYLRNPLVAYAKRLIDGGRIGRIVRFRGCHNEDYMASPETPFAWRCDPAIAGKGGSLGDLGGHIVSIARYLIGEIGEVCGSAQTVIADRPTSDGRGRRAVGNDDQAQFLVNFRSGVAGLIECSRVASGRKMDISYEISGTTGAIAFDGERLGEIRLYVDEGAADSRGFRTIYVGPQHPPYGRFTPAQGHGLGFNDHKVIEVYELMQAVANGARPMTDLTDAARISRVTDAVLESSASRRWVVV